MPSHPQQHSGSIAKDTAAPQPCKVSENPTLSVCMIVRDEEGVLRRCLESVKHVADELVVVDTGSKDNTISIARAFDARVFDYEWRDDFAAARNYSLKHVTGDWTLHIDADEELVSDSIPYLRKCIVRSSVLCYAIRCDNGPRYLGPRFGWFDRLFRSHPRILYDGPYHETVSQSVRDLTVAQPGWQMQFEPNVILRHYGYEQSSLSEKHERGLPIMQSYLKANPNDAYMLSQLGASYSGLGRYGEAESCLRRALEIDSACPTTNFTLGVTLQEQGKLETAVEFYQKAIMRDPFLAEAYASLGAICIEKGLLDNAIGHLRKSLDINPHLAMAHCNLGLAYTNKGMYDEGISSLKRAVAINPDLAGAHMNLGMAYAKKRMLNEALVEYEQALTIDPDYAKVHYNLAVVYYKTGKHTKAIKHCDRAKELGAEIHPSLMTLLDPFR